MKMTKVIEEKTIPKERKLKVIKSRTVIETKEEFEIDYKTSSWESKIIKPEEVITADIDWSQYIKDEFSKHEKRESEQMRFLELEIERLDKTLNLIKSQQLDFREIELPKSFQDFLKKCKEIKGLTLYLEKQKENFIIWVKFDKKVSIKNRDKFFEIFTDFEIKNIEYEFRVKVTFDDLSDKFESLI